tara:strand:- start:10037 stop:10471 length:435 start_codon:yes stop_codon:yes gene_type:complete
MKLRHEIWLPHLKFTLQTMSLNYPLNPNEVTIRKYYNFIQNLPVFFPDEPLGKSLSKLLDDFPVSPYLNSRTSFMKWVHFLFNKINEKLEIRNVSFYESLEEYYQHYKPRELINKESIKNKKNIMYSGTIVFLLSSSIYFYKRS